MQDGTFWLLVLVGAGSCLHLGSPSSGAPRLAGRFEVIPVVEEARGSGAIGRTGSPASDAPITGAADACGN